MALSLRSLIVAGVLSVALLTMCSGPALLRAPEAAQVLPVAPPRVVLAGRAEPLSTASAPRVPATPTAAPLPPPAPADMPVGPLNDLGYQIDGYLNELVNASLFQGQVLVANRAGLVLNKAYGLADANTGAPNTTKTHIRLASVSKQFTAMAIMQLVAAGRLGLDDPICAHLEACPDAWRPIVIRHLLTHSSGLPNYTDFAEFDATEAQPTTPQELVGRFRDLPLHFAPGSAFAYNNSGYVLLALIVERASGQSYEQFLRAHIFDVIGMSSSGVDHNAGAITAGAQGHHPANVVAPFLDASTLYGAGSLYATAEDLYRWDRALYSDVLLPAPLRDQLWTPFLGNYGLGWKLATVNGHRVVYHPGNIQGFATFIARYPDDGVIVIVLSNLMGANAPGISGHIAGMVLDK
jgi:CubicO group peptidase (beta-lactamase class C family)